MVTAYINDRRVEERPPMSYACAVVRRIGQPCRVWGENPQVVPGSVMYDIASEDFANLREYHGSPRRLYRQGTSHRPFDLVSGALCKERAACWGVYQKVGIVPPVQAASSINVNRMIGIVCLMSCPRGVSANAV